MIPTSMSGFTCAVHVLYDKPARGESVSSTRSEVQAVKAATKIPQVTKALLAADNHPWYPSTSLLCTFASSSSLGGRGRLVFPLLRGLCCSCRLGRGHAQACCCIHRLALASTSARSPVHLQRSLRHGKRTKRAKKCWKTPMIVSCENTQSFPTGLKPSSWYLLLVKAWQLYHNQAAHLENWCRVSVPTITRCSCCSGRRCSSRGRCRPALLLSSFLCTMACRCPTALALLAGC